MTVYNHSSAPLSGAAVVFGQIGRSLSALHLTLRDWNDRRVTRRLLNGLTDRELSDIGLMRGDIDAIN
ncbi:DUF1127 domain-containing protein [Pseudooceanicola sp. C21-150M6]|uniref:DUF1127 domain-containing protein n=1 Tax=Pseudooceanicola sp. C21-150M6 TaxID=3434355 RepID=UPI003D7FBCCA